MKRFIANAFALSMIEGDLSVHVKTIALDTVKHWLGCMTYESVVGHADIAAVMSSLTGTEIKVNRVSIKLNPGDQMLVAQYMGPRLPEGTQTLPEGAEIVWKNVTVEGPLVDNVHPYSPHSLYGAMMAAGEKIACSVGGQAEAKNDDHGNFMVEITAHGFRGTMWDE